MLNNLRELRLTESRIFRFWNKWLEIRQVSKQTVEQIINLTASLKSKKRDVSFSNVIVRTDNQR